MHLEKLQSIKWSFDYINKILYEWQRKGMTAEKYEERENDETNIV